MNAKGKIAFKTIVIGILLAISIYAAKLDIKHLIAVFTNFKVSHAILIITAFIINFHLVASRLYLSYKQFKINISYDAAKRALLSGILGGIVPVFGGIISQSHQLHFSSNISSTSSSFIYIYDKIIMAISGMLISIIATRILYSDWFVFERLLFGSTNNQECHVSLLEFILALGLSFVTTYFYGLKARDKGILSKYISMRNISYVVGGMGISLLTWCLSAACFTLCVKFLGINEAVSINYIGLFSASVIVSFISSIPVSVNGWGVREFAAITLFGIIAIPTEVALGAAISIGILSTVSLIAIALYALFQQLIWSKIAFN